MCAFTAGLVWVEEVPLPAAPTVQGGSHKLFDYRCTECGPLANVLVSQGLPGEVGALPASGKCRLQCVLLLRWCV